MQQIIRRQNNVLIITYFRQNTVTAWNLHNKAHTEESEELYTAQQAQIKQGWSLLATLHCVLLPDKVEQRGAKNFKRPQVEMMARRWQHHCLEVNIFFLPKKVGCL